MRSVFHFLFLPVALAAPFAMTVRAEELTEARFRELHQALRPSAKEAWRTIPWRTAMLQAQRAAIKANKPIFIWAMDGHPLGCT